MPYGWAGNILEIDLSQGKIERRQSDSKLNETYLGGEGVNAKILWDRVPPEVDPFSPDNLLIFGTGVLTGTPAPAANHGAVSFKSPLTNLFTYSNVGGFWPAELKHAGYDTLVISGKSPTPIYLWINNDNVEIRDASHLWGKDTVETPVIIQKELKNNKIQTICIGPAGENKAHMASIEHGNGSSISRAGPGAIMGDKNIKAIAVYGTKDIYIAKPTEFIELCDYVLKKAETFRNWWEENYLVGKVGQSLANVSMFGNMDEMPPDLGFEDMGADFADFLKKYMVRELACYNCPHRCKEMILLPEVGYVPIKCQVKYYFRFAAKIQDMVFAIKCHDLCVRNGLDYVSASQCISLAIDLYQKGILTKEDTEGMPLEWENPEVVLSLIEKIVRREGIGAILANGVYEASRLIGRGAEKHAHHIKKLEPFVDAMYQPYASFIAATSDKDAHTALWTTPVGDSPEKREAYLKEGWGTIPDELKKYLTATYEVDYEGLGDITAYAENLKILIDLTGVCWFLSGFWPYPPLKLDTIVNLISCATGMDIDEAKALKTAERAGSLMQALNVRIGLRRKDDTLPEKFFQEPPTPRQQKAGLVQLDRDKFNKALDRLYELKGRNNDAIPTKEKLEELGLDYVKQDLERRGILTNEDNKNNKN